MVNRVPTILIGLGGIGSQIVNTIYGQIPENNRNYVAVHAFDTDVNTLRSMEYLTNQVTQTSTRKTVGEYLHENPIVLTWFPDNPHLRDKTMTEGAGQIRAVSRLAFRSAMAAGKMNALWETIDRIFPVNGDRTTYGIRVIIITSMAGGTGSGIFLQIAMYMREMLKRKFGHSNILIRGAFLLPDILIRTNTIDEREWESVRANGYASLKELNAITMTASQHFDNKKGVTIDLEYRPNQVDLQGRNTHAITIGQRPYDFCFLYDYENTDGKNLSSLSQYIDQVARTIYLQLFSPISIRHFSQEDNQILQIIDSEGLGRYCGAAASTLCYPYEDILEYLALKWAVSGLNDSWLILDKRFEEEQQRYELDLRKGINRDRPQKESRYIWYLDQFVNSDKPNPFFKYIYRQTREELAEGKLGESKVKRFIEAVEKRVLQVLNGDEELKRYEAECRLDEGKLKMKKLVRQEIGRVESSLSYFQDQINKKVYEYRTFISYQVVDEDENSPEGTDGEEFRLNTWFLRKPGPLHPVAARYLLYQINIEMKNRIKELREDNENLRKRIEQYKDTYDLKDTDHKETAIERVDQAINSGFLKSKKNLNKFIKEYQQKSHRQLANLNLYKQNLLLELVFSSIQQAIERMIQAWERFFDNLKDIRDHLQIEINHRAVKYENYLDPTKQYVLATKDLQEAIWESIRQSVDQGMLPDDISKEIYLSHYRQYCKKSQAIFGLYSDLRVEDLYRENVLQFCRKELRERYRDRIDLNIIQALRKEAQMLNQPVELYIKERIGILDNLSKPFIPNIENCRELKYWGIHSESYEELGERLINEIFEEKEIVDVAFSKYEIISYNAHYGLNVNHFSKFSSGSSSENYTQYPGVYYEAYQKRIERLNKGKSTVTPHLDKRWHLPAFMPDLNPRQVIIDTKKNDRAFLLGLIYGWIQLVNDNGRKVYQYSGISGSSLIYRNGGVVTEELYNLHDALSHNPVIYEEILTRVEEHQREQLGKVRELREHLFIIGSKKMPHVEKDGIHSILDAVLAFESEGLGDEALPAIGDRLRKQLMEEIIQYHLKHFGQRQVYRAQLEAARLIDLLWNDSVYRQIVLQFSGPESPEYKNCQNFITNTLNSIRQFA